MGIEEDNEADSDACDLSCLVAVGHLHPHFQAQVTQDISDVRPLEFSSRNTLDGKFTYVDQR